MSVEQATPIVVPAQPVTTARSYWAESRKILAYGQLADSYVSLYQAPSSLMLDGRDQHAFLKRIIIANTDEANVQKATLYLVENGGSVAPNRMILPEYPLDPAGSVGAYWWHEFSEPGLYLPKATAIYGYCPGSDLVTYFLEGSEVK